MRLKNLTYNIEKDVLITVKSGDKFPKTTLEGVAGRCKGEVVIAIRTKTLCKALGLLLKYLRIVWRVLKQNQTPLGAGKAGVRGPGPYPAASPNTTPP